MTGVYEDGGVFPELSLRRESELVDLRKIDDRAEVGPERFDAEAELADNCEWTEMSDLPDAAEVERRLSGKGGIGGCDRLSGDAGEPIDVLLLLG